MRFNAPPGWPQPPIGWVPPVDWVPDSSWPPPPPGWQLWVPDKNDLEVDETGPAVAESAAGSGYVDDSVLAAGAGQGNQDEGQTEQVAALQARIGELETQLSKVRAGAGEDVVDLNDQRVLQQAGIYRYHHPLEDAAAYKDRLRETEAQIDSVIKVDRAVLATDMFTLSGSLAQGRKMVGDLSKLMLRAYNAEAENCVRTLRAANLAAVTKRLDRSVATIEKLGASMEMRINPEYHQLRIKELELTADYQMKVQEEREQAREERAQLREQQRAERELAAERERLNKERAHYVSVLESLQASGETQAADEFAGRLEEIDAAIEANDYRIANIRAGYVYVISNVGAFGPNVVKIGMTRRLEPRDRIRELGDASVPFRYDVHALFFSDNAVTLENELHKEFAERRLNMVNQRREFFFATPQEVRDVLAAKVGGLLEFNDTPDAHEYFQSRSSWPERE